MKIVGIVLLLYITINFIIPMKFAILEEDIDKERSYIVVEFVGATDEYWKVIDYSDDLKDLVNKNPEILTRTMLSDTSIESFFYEFHITGNNKFVCYGKYTDLDTDLDIISRESDENPAPRFINYELEDWDIIYPIKRYGYGFLPKSYLCNADFKGLLFIII